VFSVLASDGGKPRKVTEIASLLQTNPEVLCESIFEMLLFNMLT
jgi:hypothetical protein